MYPQIAIKNLKLPVIQTQKNIHHMFSLNRGNKLKPSNVSTYSDNFRKLESKKAPLVGWGLWGARERNSRGKMI